MNDSFVMLHQTQESDVRIRLASNLRRLRVARHMSLSALARSTTMSKATLSGIERGQANPTVDTLATLAAAFNVPITELLEKAQESEILIVRSSQADPASARFRASSLESIESRGSIELAQVDLPARHVQDERPQSIGSRRHLLVLDGTMIAGPVDRISELAVGDYASFPADVPHLYETPRDRARALVITHTPG